MARSPRTPLPVSPVPDHAARATGYARDVAAGRVEVCELVRAACKRHLRDLKAKGRWRYDAAKANRACEFIELLPHVKGRWAQRAETIRLEDWQCFLVGSLFGWVDAAGMRRFRTGLLLVPRKNAKSTLAAGIGLYMAFMDGEAGSEVYSGATSEKQAWEVFGPARLMAERAEGLADALGVTVAARSIFSADQSRFQPVIGKPGDGSSPHCAIIDEYHEHDSPDQFDTMVTGMGAREQPLALVITTAGDNIGGPCFELQRHAEDMLRGVIDDDRLFALIYGIDKKDDPNDFAVWAKANPNLGVSVMDDFLRDRHRETLERPAKRGVNLTKHLNVWVTARSAWLSVPKWQALGDRLLDEGDYAGCSATIGCDLAAKIDIAAAVARVERPGGGVALFPRLYLPEGALAAGGKNTASYRAWAEAGHVIVTPGDVIDFSRIEDDLRAWLSLFQVTALGFDPWQAVMISQRLMADGAPVVEFGMNPRNLAAPSRAFEAHVEGGTMAHTANPCFDWMASNVTAREDARGNIYPRKPPNSEHLKIDGIMAAIMAEGLAMATEAPTHEPMIMSLD